MLLRNHAARLITINARKDGVTKRYDVLPGDNPATEVPDEYCKSDFVRNLIDIDPLSVVPAELAEEAPKKRGRKPAEQDSEDAEKADE